MPGELIQSMLKHRIDTGIHQTTFPLLVLLPLLIITAVCAPEHWALENSVIETSQLLILGLGIIFCCTANHNKSLYYALATVLFFLCLREINFGRVLFCSKNGQFAYCGEPTDYYKWKELPHGPTIRLTLYIITGIIIAMAVFCKQNYKKVLSIFTAYKIPVPELLLAATGALISKIIDLLKLHYPLQEECAETLMYAAIISALYRYTRRLAPYSPPPATPQN